MPHIEWVVGYCGGKLAEVGENHFLLVLVNLYIIEMVKAIDKLLSVKYIQDRFPDPENQYRGFSFGSYESMMNIVDF